MVYLAPHLWKVKFSKHNWRASSTIMYSELQTNWTNNVHPIDLTLKSSKISIKVHVAHSLKRWRGANQNAGGKQSLNCGSLKTSKLLSRERPFLMSWLLFSYYYNPETKWDTDREISCQMQPLSSTWCSQVAGQEKATFGHLFGRSHRITWPHWLANGCKMSQSQQVLYSWGEHAASARD